MPNIGLTATLTQYYEWSKKTFGDGERTREIVAHVQKELNEVIADYEKGHKPEIPEWIDIFILTLDALCRQGYTPLQILQLYKKKVDINYNRKWASNIPGKPTEHIREDTKK